MEMGRLYIVNMHQDWNGELEDADDREEYIQEKDPKKISAILKAEEQYKNKAHEESILKIIDEKQTTPVPKDLTHSITPKFIQDDRERTYIKQQDQPQPVQTSTKGKQAREQNNKFQKEGNKEDQRDKKPKYESKEPKRSNENAPENHPKKIIYVEKVKEEPEPRRKEQPQPKKKKYAEKQPEKKRRKQTDLKNGEEIQIELLADDDQFENQIYVGKRDVGIYFEKARDMIQEYDFIVIKSFALYVSKAFVVAGLMGREFPQLKQINIPSTVDVLIHNKKGSKERIRGAIHIELSLHKLNVSHIGYQEVPKKVQDVPVKLQPKDSKIESKEKKEGKVEYREKKQHREKPQFKHESKTEPKKYQEKRKVFPSNRPRRQERRWHEDESSQQKERALR